MDTSALVAVLLRESHYQALLNALANEDSRIPAPVLVEFTRVTAAEANAPSKPAERLVARLLTRRSSLMPFGVEAARLAAAANEAHGRGNGRGGRLNILDLMVLGCARAEGRLILCTGRDFEAADRHPASRPW